MAEAPPVNLTMPSAQPISVYEWPFRVVSALVCVSAKGITLCLREVLRQALRSIAVVVGEARAHGGDRDSGRLGETDDLSPRAVTRLHDAAELRVE